MNDERISTVHHDLRISSDPIHWAVWLEPHDGEMDGVCIGTGETRNGAVQNAVLSLEEALTKLTTEATEKGNL